MALGRKVTLPESHCYLEGELRQPPVHTWIAGFTPFFIFSSLEIRISLGWYAEVFKIPPASQKENDSAYFPETTLRQPAPSLELDPVQSPSLQEPLMWSLRLQIKTIKKHLACREETSGLFLTLVVSFCWQIIEARDRESWLQGMLKHKYFSTNI